MADVKMPKSIPCQFDARGWKPCKKPTDNGWCTEHEALTCSSCGAQATRPCDSQMGGLGCGSPLCGTCEHARGGKHVTKEVANQRRAAARTKEEAKIAARTSSERWVNNDGLPATLSELLKGDWQGEGFVLTHVFYLELDHRQMGNFPVVFDHEERRMVFTDDLRLMEQVWQTLRPREVRLVRRTAYVHPDGIFYLDPFDITHREEAEPDKLLTQEEFDALKNTDEAFRWTFGLFGGRNYRMDTFLHSLSKQARGFDPAFESAFQ